MVYQMRIKSIKQRIAEHFMKHPTVRLRVRQIEREVKVPLPSAIRYAKELEQEKILKTIDIAGVKLYAADRLSEAYLLEKRIFNLRSLYQSNLLNHLLEKYHNATIVLFGSYAKGEDIERSDIDLYVETPQKEVPLEKYEKKLQRAIQLFPFKNIKDVKNKELANNIVNGVTLHGFLEVL
jgi:predicted nucleotidyltransferase